MADTDYKRISRNITYQNRKPERNVFRNMNFYKVELEINFFVAILQKDLYLHNEKLDKNEIIEKVQKVKFDWIGKEKDFKVAEEKIKIIQTGALETGEDFNVSYC